MKLHKIKQKPHFMIGRQSGDHRPNDGRYPASHRPTVWQSSADWHPMIGRPVADNMMKMSSKRRPTVGRSSPDAASPMTKPMKIGGFENETFKLDASTTKSSADQKISQIRCRHRPIVGPRRPILHNFARRRRTVGFCNVTVILL